MTATDTKLQDLTDVTSWSASDLMYIVSDPSGSPADEDMTLEDLFTNIVTGVNLLQNNGIDVGDGTAADIDLVTINDDGAAQKLWWDNSERDFVFSTSVQMLILVPPSHGL